MSQPGTKGIRAVLCGYYGMGNGGDEALLATLLQMLPDGVIPLVLSGNPRETAERYGVTACDRKSLRQVWRALRQADVFIWGGGSLMQDSTSLGSAFYYGGLMELAQRLGLKTIAWAQGIGPLRRSLPRWLARRNFRGCDWVSVRDRASGQLLDDWGISFTLAPDPVWALRREAVPGLWDLPAPRVAVVLRPHPDLTPARLEVLAHALGSFQQATDTCILLIPFHPSQDLAIAHQVLPYLSSNSHILPLSDPHQLRGVFEGVEMAIAMRLHGLIMAAAADCSCFALSYDPKVTQLMVELDLPGWELDEIPLDSAKITTTWLELYANGEPLSPDQRSAIGDRARLHEHLLREALT